MKKLLALALCLCFALEGCAQNAALSERETVPSLAPAPASSSSPAESPEHLALRLAALPDLPSEPDESAFWDTLSNAGAEERDRLWEVFRAEQTAYQEAVQALRSDGVDPSLVPAFASYTLRTARQLMEAETEKNIVYSPANLYLALCMLCETTDGNSRDQLLKLLELSSVEEARAAASSLWRNLYRDGATDVTLPANSLWLNETLDYHEDTVDTLSTQYYASTFRAPMGDPSTDAAIAGWINENTNGLLSDAAAGLETTGDTLMMLISTLYFKGSWSDPFSDGLTSEDTFTAADGTEQKYDFMHKTNSGNYYRGDRFIAASLPFRNGESMWFLLPDEGVSVQDALLKTGSPFNGFDASPDSTLDTAFGSVIAEQGFADIAWSVPRFDVNSDLDLIPSLRSLGVTDIFDSETADFSKLTELEALVSTVEHAARVKVNEDGCEAAAFTAIMTECTSALVEPLPVVEMKLNRPFGFLITGTDGLPLFVGIVNTLE